MSVFKVCTLCKKTYSKEEWDRLPSIGKPLVWDEGDQVITTVMKNCDCNGTMAIEIVEEQPKK